jgi:predicted Zn-dependent protease
MRAMTLAAAALMCVSVAASFGAPYVPKDGSEVLERLRDRPLDTSARELRTLRQALGRDPDNISIATRMARRYIEESRAQGDPRFLGYAQAALRPWWTLSRPPDAVLVLRATIRQSNHEFESALGDLSQVLKTSPANGQAWLTRATILQVKGEYVEAERSCEPLARLAPQFVSATCVAGIESMTGQAEKSYRSLQEVTQRNPAGSDAETVWMETALAEIATRLDLRSAAEGHFKRALQRDAADPYLKAAYADFLLDAGRPGEVVRLLSADARIDGLLLRLALAQQALGSPDAARNVANLQARFDAARARGDRVHQREEARFNTQLLKQPREALRLAQANWTVQKEPADARVLVEAALAAGERAAAQPVVDWMRKNKVQDAALQRLIRRIEQS